MNDIDHIANPAANDPFSVIGFSWCGEICAAMFAFEHRRFGLMIVLNWLRKEE
jgi:hypothetical protein